MEADAATPPHAGLQTLDYVTVGLYLLMTLAIVVWSLRRQSSTEDYFLGGRRMPWFAVGLSLLATLLSTISYLGNPGEVIKYGLALFSGQLALPLTMSVVLFLWIPFFMRLRLTSAYEYLEHRFDYRARLLGGLLFLFLRLGWMSLVMYTASLALAQMSGLDILWIVVCVGVAATLYTCIGGIAAIIWTDVLQFLMLIGGTFITIGYVIIATGNGPTEWWRFVSDELKTHTSPALFSFDLTERMTVLTAVIHTFFWTICTHGSDQVVLQRYFSTTSLSSARRSYIVNAISDVCMSFLLALSGLALLYFYLKHPSFLPNGMRPTSGDKVMPYFFAHQLPIGLGGILLASFLCDAMQTLNSGVNSITAVASSDLLERLFPAGMKQVSQLRLARLMTIGIGLVVTLLGFVLTYYVQHSGRTIVDIMPKAFNMFLGPLASLFFIGMFLPRSTARTAVPAALCGLAVAILWSYWEIPFGGKPLTITLAIALPCLSSCGIAALLSLFFENGEYHPGREYVWRAVMQRPIPQPTAAAGVVEAGETV